MNIRFFLLSLCFLIAASHSFESYAITTQEIIDGKTKEGMPLVWNNWCTNIDGIIKTFLAEEKYVTRFVNRRNKQIIYIKELENGLIENIILYPIKTNNIDAKEVVDNLTELNQNFAILELTTISYTPDAPNSICGFIFRWQEKASGNIHHQAFLLAFNQDRGYIILNWDNVSDINMNVNKSSEYNPQYKLANIATPKNSSISHFTDEVIEIRYPRPDYIKKTVPTPIIKNEIEKIKKLLDGNQVKINGWLSRITAVPIETSLETSLNMSLKKRAKKYAQKIKSKIVGTYKNRIQVSTTGSPPTRR